jgi:peptidoglycan/xylan/chitin deacetylase (PgdA/CDA1 family)
MKLAIQMTVVAGAILTASLMAAEPVPDKTEPVADTPEQLIKKGYELAAKEAQEAAGEPKLNCLTKTPKKARFAVTDKVWPAEHGQAHLCLWHDDRLAAFSFTIDDNCAPYHAWWLEQGEKYGFKFTWFVITGLVNTGGYWGTWDGWKTLKAAGHDIQSHTVTHLGGSGKPEWKGVNWEYADSIRQIEENLPGHKVLALAYPGGKNTKMNSREIAAKYYIAGRGTAGILNGANSIDYFNIHATGGVHVRDDDKSLWANARNLLDKSRYRGRQYRGWAVHLSHGVKAAQKEALGKIFEFLKANREKLWVGIFANVAKYGQERDTATLKVTRADDAEVRFTLTDTVDDKLFDQPLTIKIRVKNTWKTVTATQGDKPIEATVIEHAGGRFALVHAVPDRGEVILAPGGAKP